MRRAFPLLFLCIGAAGPAAAQYAAPGTGGVAALTEALQQLGTNKRVLVIGAHPDDENTQLLTLVSRGMGGRAAYLSLTRGEGGQNLIGPELGFGLGLIRAEELLAARSLDGAEQYFTRAYDFGYSKSADEAFTMWPHDSLLADVLAVIRRFRPQIIVSVFWGTARDGHGQHQVAGLLAHEAYRVLRDSAWGPAKLYRSTFRDTEASTLDIPVGVLDPVTGRSYAQIAAASRSQHRSQDMGQLLRPGPALTRLALVEARAPGPDTALFAGIDTSVPGPTGAHFAALIDTARARLDPWAPGGIVPYLVRARALLPAGDAERAATLERAIAIAGGLALDGVADDGIVAAGERLEIEATVWNAGSETMRVDSLTLAAPRGWAVEPLDPAASVVAPGAVLTRRFAVTVPADAPRTEPYFLRRPPVGALYDWTGVPPAVRGLPFEPAPLSVRARVTLGGTTLTLTREVVHRYRDQAIGEIRRPLFVTQPFDVAVRPETVVWPLDGGRGGARGTARAFTVTVTNRTRGAATAELRFAVPDGWRPVAPVRVTFEREDETRAVQITLQAPPGVRPGDVMLGAAAVGTDGRVSDGSLGIVDYPHIRPRSLSSRAESRLHLTRLALPAVRRVGYVRGASDRVPEELQAIGVPVELLGPDSLARGDLAVFDAIVIGSRAYETDPALAAANARLLEYARAGGLVIVQYQQYQFVDGNFAPLPLSIRRPHDRVTDETAPVTLLEPSHPVLRAPNAIGPGDWDGWVQERGLYFAHTWDRSYTAVLEMGDAGGPPLQGGLLIARVGRGTYVYTGLAFFRQLPAGVPGAFRLFLNLLGLRERHVP